MHRYSDSNSAERRTVALLLLALLISGCATAPPTAPASVSLMTFNVENLFDTADDPGKDDRTYLPLSAKQTAEHRAACARIERDFWREQCLYWDWNESVVERKLRVVADAILQVDGGRGPDIVVLQEVENIGILERLRTEYLQDAGYRRAILLEGNDDRGIDVAFLSRLPLIGRPVLHTIPFEGFPAERIADTRGILEATFRLPDGEPLTAYAVHFPAPYHPYEMRIQAYLFLDRLRAELPPGRLAFAAGDFNTPAREDAEQRMLDRFVRPGWRVAHESGCGECAGTNYYRAADSWSFLDMILWSRTPGTWRLKEGSARLANGTPAQVTAEGHPNRFRMPGATGVSDHWPLVVEIEPANPS